MQRTEIGNAPVLMRQLVDIYESGDEDLLIRRKADVVLVQLMNTTAEDIKEKYFDAPFYSVSRVHDMVREEIVERYIQNTNQRWQEGKA